METLTRGGRMDLTERPICFSSSPPAFMTGQACHIIHSDCPTVALLANACSDPARKKKYTAVISPSLIIYAQTHLLWHLIDLLNRLKLVFVRKVVFIHITGGGNVCPSCKCHQGIMYTLGTSKMTASRFLCNLQIFPLSLAHVTWMVVKMWTCS